MLMWAHVSRHPGVYKGALPSSATRPSASVYAHRTLEHAKSRNRSSPYYTIQAPNPHTLDYSSCVNTPRCTLQQPPCPGDPKLAAVQSAAATAQLVHRLVLAYRVVAASSVLSP
jgi:hypothetical protein